MNGGMHMFLKKLEMGEEEINIDGRVLLSYQKSILKNTGSSVSIIAKLRKVL